MKGKERWGIMDVTKFVRGKRDRIGRQNEVGFRMSRPPIPL